MKNLHLKNIAGLLIDLDGVVYISNQAIPGAAEAIERLKSKKIPLRFVTNTTTMSQDSLHKKMVSMGLPIEKHEIISAVQAAVLYLRYLGGVWRQVSSPDASPNVNLAVRSGDLTAQKHPTCYLVLTEDCKKDFAEFKQTDKNPDFVIIGDLESGGPPSGWVPANHIEHAGTHLKGGPPQSWTYPLLNKIFNMLITGSKMIALHKGKFWQTASGLTLDIGIFVAGLEYVTGQTATVIGKPSKTFFELALRDLGVPASKAAMIGDDLDNDIAGAQAVGMKAILVKTGKYREELVKKAKVKADLILTGFYEL